MTEQLNSSDRNAEAAKTARVVVFSSSVRSERMSPTITQWAVSALRTLEGADLEVVDLAEVKLPDDGDLYPGGGPRSEIAGLIEAADAYVFVTPEYNHSYPASLKRLIDWHYSEWMFKPATVVAFGARGGHSATEHLRGVLAELNVVTTRRTVNLAAPWESMQESGDIAPGKDAEDAVLGAGAELLWWAETLTQARANRPFEG